MMRTIGTAILLLALTACTPVVALPAQQKPDEPEANIESQETVPMPQKPPVLNATVSQAVRDLATQLGISPDSVTVVAAETVVWADSALGCPEPGAMYMQALQEGMRIRLQVGSQLYHYHSSATRKPFLCQQPTEPAAVTPSAAHTPSSVGRPLDVQAMEDLATRLKIERSSIELVRMEEVDWPDGSLGCPQPGMRYKQVVVNGTFIQLRAGGQVYNYHSGNTRPPFLCTSKDEVLPEDLSNE
jgi:hypothetical protein